MCLPKFRLLPLLLVGLALASLAASPVPDGDPRLQATMHRLVGALGHLLPLAAMPDGFSAPERQASVGSALEELARASADLTAHVRGRDEGLRSLGRTLEDDAVEAFVRWRAGRPTEARYLVERLTGECVACHASASDDAARDLAPRLVSEEVLAAAPLRTRARLAFATRRFDEGLGHLEAAFRDEALAPVTLDASGDLARYLSVAIRVRAQPARARAALLALVAREDVPLYLRQRLQSWISALADPEVAPQASPDLTHVRTLIDRAVSLREFPAQRTGLVYELAAAAEARRFLERPDVPAFSRAQALYLLGSALAVSSVADWQVEADALLEASIRELPESPFAAQAFAALEERVTLSWSGSSGAEVPEDVARWLGTLRDAVPALGKNAAIQRGAAVFARHCTACHGAGARGDGAEAAALSVPPPDLTLIAARNAGTFPAARVHAIVDGREPVKGHHSLEMPAWGLTFRERGRDVGDGGAAQGDLRDLVQFLESVQAVPSTPAR